MKRKNVVAAGHQVTVEAAREILWLGGNAFDAAVGAVFAAMVAEFGLTSAGGAGYLMATTKGDVPIVYDFFVEMPRGQEPDNLDFFPVEVDFGGATQEFHVGRASAGVPGNVAGLLQVQEELGRLALPDVLAPSVRAARDGVVFTEHQAYLLQILRPILTHSKEGRELYAPDGKLLTVGDTLRMPDFSDFLLVLSREGREFFYLGEAARIMTEWSEGQGGLLTKADFEQYRVVKRNPVKTRFTGYDVYLNPPPAQSGVLIDVTLSLLEREHCERGRNVSLADLVRAFDVTNQLRAEMLPVGSVHQLQAALSADSRCEKYLKKYRQDERGASEPPVPSAGSTTHISVLDAEGKAASVTTTNGEGCGYVIPGLGFMPNNMLGEQDLNPQGFHRYAPGERLSSMVAPTIVVQNGEPILVTGTAGSNRIRSVLTQLLLWILYEGRGVEAATEFPRVHLEGDLLSAEPGVPEEELRSLENRYSVHRWPKRALFFGGANSVTPEEGAGDSRRGGCSFGSSA
ncbi:MAG TPA: gamma-glutamyltransferase [Acidobacteriota bacterium]|nr:gamma-glutamyltransferase [Acidobacteriota bacterium]